MAAINVNRLSVTLTPQQLQELRTAFSTIETLLFFAEPVTKSQRVSLPKINIQNRTFVEDTLHAVTNNPGFLPPYFSAEQLGKDYELYSQLNEFLQRARQLCERLDDTRLLAGSEAYAQALTAYRHFETAALAGLPGADAPFETLKARFKRHGHRKISQKKE